MANTYTERNVVTYRRFRTAWAVRRILFGERPKFSDPTYGISERLVTYTWAKIIGFFCGTGRVTYGEIFKIARDLKPRLKPYPKGHFYKWDDQPFRTAFSKWIRKYELELGPETRTKRRKYFMEGLAAGKRKMATEWAFERNLCPCCLTPLPCTFHGIGKVVREGRMFREVAPAPVLEYDLPHVQDEAERPSPQEEEVECREALRSCLESGECAADDGGESDLTV